MRLRLRLCLAVIFSARITQAQEKDLSTGSTWGLIDDNSTYMGEGCKGGTGVDPSLSAGTDEWIGDCLPALGSKCGDHGCWRWDLMYNSISMTNDTGRTTLLMEDMNIKALYIPSNASAWLVQSLTGAGPILGSPMALASWDQNKSLRIYYFCPSVPGNHCYPKPSVCEWSHDQWGSEFTAGIVSKETVCPDFGATYKAGMPLLYAKVRTGTAYQSPALSRLSDGSYMGTGEAYEVGFPIRLHGGNKITRLSSL